MNVTFCDTYCKAQSNFNTVIVSAVYESNKFFLHLDFLFISFAERLKQNKVPSGIWLLQSDVSVTSSCKLVIEDLINVLHGLQNKQRRKMFETMREEAAGGYRKLDAERLYGIQASCTRNVIGDMLGGMCGRHGGEVHTGFCLKNVKERDTWT